MLAPLQLVNFAIERLVYELSRPEADAIPAHAASVSLGFMVEMESDVNGVHVLRLRVDVNQNPTQAKADGRVTHRASITIAGWFKWVNPEGAARRGTRQRMLLVNGLSTLYGMVRTEVLHLTEPGPSPRLLLPSVNFVPLVDKWLTEEQHTDATPA